MNNYLPNSFDERITILEKINKLIYALGDLHEQVSLSITELNDMYSEIYVEYTSLHNQVNELVTTTATKTELVTTNTNVTNLASRIGSLETNTATKTELGTTNTNVTNLASRTTTIEGKIADSGHLTPTFADGITAYSASSTPTYRKIGNVVYFSGAIKGVTLATTGDTLVTTLPTGYRPTKTWNFIQGGSGGSFVSWNVGSNGSVYIVSTTNASPSTSTWYPFSFAWLVD